MIPKKIHYCWFGTKTKPNDVVDYIDGWNNLLTDYEIIEWNESNFDINECEFIANAYKNGKWAFVSDYVRLRVLNEYGGIYLDTDIEIINNFDDYLKYEGFLGFMYNCALGTAVIGSKKGSKFTADLLQLYKSNKVKLDIPNNILVTEYFIGEHSAFHLNNEKQILGGILIEPKEIFEQPSFKKKHGISIHHYMNSWINTKEEVKSYKLFIKEIIYNNHILLYFLRKYRCSVDMRRNPLYESFINYGAKK
ncbi:glycosyltransferase family 32 protein [Vibrio breoganii]